MQYATDLDPAEKLKAIRQYEALLDPRPTVATIKQYTHMVPTKAKDVLGAQVSIKDNAITIDSKTYCITHTQAAALVCTLLAVLQDSGFFCSREACPNEHYNEHYAAYTIRAMIDAMIDEHERINTLEADRFE